jgi:hypothetical protein
MPDADNDDQPVEATAVQIAENMPGIFAAAEDCSATGQSRFKLLAGWALFLLVVSAACGLVEKAWAGWVAAATFVGSIVLTGLWIHRRAEHDWYDGRACAESAKSLTFKYAVGGQPFAVGAERADSLYEEALEELVSELEGLDSTFKPSAHPPDTAELRALRMQGRDARTGVYRKQRLEDQHGWYIKRATEHRATARRWQAMVVALEVAGVIGAILKALEVVSIDLLSFFAAAGAAAAAWLTAGDYVAAARAYDFAAFELDAAMSRLARVSSEADWAAFVADAEQAMSREHTTWLARRRDV